MYRSPSYFVAPRVLVACGELLIAALRCVSLPGGHSPASAGDLRLVQPGISHGSSSLLQFIYSSVIINAELQRIAAQLQGAVSAAPHDVNGVQPGLVGTG